MKLFNSESEMQEWMSQKLRELDGVGELIIGAEDVDDLKTSSPGEDAIVSSYRACFESLWINEVISEDENISISSGESLRPDFLLYAPETESVVVVELKNIAGPTREAGTELGAYTGEIRTVIPFISSADIVHVVVSNEWPVLLRHYIYHEIFWHKRNVLCLRPTLDAAGEIGLSIVPPSELSSGSNTPVVSERHLGGYQICLYDDALQAGSKDRTRLDPYIEQMKSALHVMAAEGNSQHGHGFAFLWRDLWTLSLAPYSITVLNFCPFQTVERFIHLDLDTTPPLIEKLYNVVKEFLPEGHGKALSDITDKCEATLEHICSPRCEGFTHWGSLKEIMMPRADFISFVSWGMFSEAFNRELTERYQKGDLSTPYDCPHLGMKIVDQIIDKDYPFVDLCYWDMESDDE